MKLRLLMLGKTRREEARTLLDDYIARIRHFADVEVTELRDSGPAALRKLKLDSSATIVLLDTAGKQFTSQQFAKWLGDLRDRGTRELIFLCGDAEGFPADPPPNKKSRSLLSPCPTNLPASSSPSRSTAPSRFSPVTPIRNSRASAKISSCPSKSRSTKPRPPHPLNS
jgi:23S rRNA (pseudouridine1915-N3)-methyltransferase